ncbi:phage tail protein [Kitasatospora sp. NPDC056327]|uniref:phage tail protein n=1 Tax=Kitasatospora sp. NPDC056327 TaxID=3345785 RepID=UPI0035DC4B5F
MTWDDTDVLVGTPEAPEPAAASPIGRDLPSIYAHDPVVQAFADGIRALTGPAEHALDELADVFDPWQAPAAFLDWLARITGARVESGWSERQRRAAIDLAPWLNARRGTAEALKTEALLIHGWSLVLADPGGVHDDGSPWQGGRTLLVRLTVPSDTDIATTTQQLERLVQAHCPAHLPHRVEVNAPNAPTTTRPPADGRTPRR